MLAGPRRGPGGYAPDTEVTRACLHPGHRWARLVGVLFFGVLFVHDTFKPERMFSRVSQVETVILSWPVCSCLLLHLLL